MSQTLTPNFRAFVNTELTMYFTTPEQLPRALTIHFSYSILCVPETRNFQSFDPTQLAQIANIVLLTSVTRHPLHYVLFVIPPIQQRVFVFQKSFQIKLWMLSFW